jgi:membrane protein implicated in regulation of membrane protease activity
MSFLSMPHLSLWMSVAAIVVLFALLLVVRARRQRREDNTQPETGREIAHQLGRIADALERSSVSPETQPSEVPHDGDEKPLRHVSMSIFGR